MSKTLILSVNYHQIIKSVNPFNYGNFLHIILKLLNIKLG